MRGNKQVCRWIRSEDMQRSVTFSIVLAVCLIIAGCGQQRAHSTQTVALFQPVREGNTDMVKSLVSSQGADVNATGERGSTPLIEAARFGHEDICRLLIAAGADLTAKDNDGKTALMLAVQGDHEDVVRVLNQAGAKQ
jgi:ankyrin repeat protein